jgi:hypothetical protein
MSKAKYKIQNWSEYDAALVQRGNVTVWFAEDYVLKNWSVKPSGKRGSPLLYSNEAMEMLLILKAVFFITVSFIGRFFTFNYETDEFGIAYS